MNIKALGRGMKVALLAVMIPLSLNPVNAQTNGQGETRPVMETRNQAVAVLLKAAADHVGKGEFSQAAAALERALRIDPRDAEIWELLGQLRQLQGQPAQAEAMMAKADLLRSGQSDEAVTPQSWPEIATSEKSENVDRVQSEKLERSVVRETGFSAPEHAGPVASVAVIRASRALADVLDRHDSQQVKADSARQSRHRQHYSGDVEWRTEDRIARPEDFNRQVDRLQLRLDRKLVRIERLLDRPLPSGQLIELLEEVFRNPVWTAGP